MLLDDSHTSIEVFSFKDTSKQPQRMGGTPQVLSLLALLLLYWYFTGTKVQMLTLHALRA